ncbi:MAG: Gfo/Idh/MocA family oxidoreductase [Clostridia bacterium]|nr:Gfo/Idh/MocA family oxidoreductase [Clostridia bacterium]
MKKGCIVGYGAIGPIHAAALDKIGAEYAVCDCRPERTERAGAVEKYRDFEKMLCDKSIDVVHICTPHYLHVPMAEAALAAGKHVILEKPVGISPGEAERLFNYSGGREICIMLQNRKNPAVKKMKELTDKREYGELRSMCAFMTWHRDREYYAQDEWRGKWSTEGGGLLINQAIHTLDLLCWLGGGYVNLSGGISTRLLGDCIEVEDTADAVIKTACGVDACFYATNCSAYNNPVRIELEFENGVLRYCDNMLLYINGGDVRVLARDSAEVPGKAYWGGGHAEVIGEFYSYLDGSSESYMHLDCAKDVTRAIFDFYKSGTKNKR